MSGADDDHDPETGSNDDDHGDAVGPSRPFGWWQELGDEYDDEAEPTAPLPLEDRLWRHPSEVALATAAVDASATPPHRDRQPGRRLLAGVAVAAGLAGASLAIGVMLVASPRSATVTERVVERQLDQPVTRFASQAPAAIDVALIADSSKPSIVTVEVRNSIGSVVSSGSGVIIRDDGHVITNHHVIDGGAAVDIITADGHRHPAVIVGSDPLTDIAVLHAQMGDHFVVPVMFGSTTALRVGEPAVAIGSPLRLDGGPTVTVGVISAVGRTLDLPDGVRLYDLVQTDAPISPGSSGGALFDRNGALIGITTVVAVSDVGAEGLGFATPVEIAYDVAVDLMTDGRVRHGFLGVSGDDLTSNEAVGLGLSGGALVTGVGDYTPAAAAGLEVGDIVIALDGQSVSSMSWLVVHVRRSEPGSGFQLTVRRGDDELLLDVVLDSRP